MVVDPSASVLAGRKVRMESLATGAAREVLASEAGVYRVLSLGACSRRRTCPFRAATFMDHVSQEGKLYVSVFRAVSLTPCF